MSNLSFQFKVNSSDFVLSPALIQKQIEIRKTIFNDSLNEKQKNARRTIYESNAS